MARAILLVMDSVGIGGAKRCRKIRRRGRRHARPYRRRLRGRRGRRAGPALRTAGDSGDEPARHRAARPRLRPARIRRASRGSRSRRRSGRYASEVSKGKDTQSGHWELAGLPVPFAWGYFPNTIPAFPKDLTDALIARGEASRHSRQPARLRHRRDRGVRRGAHPHRQADLLHLRRFRLADLRPRRAFRAGAALRGLPDRAESSATRCTSAASSRGRSPARNRGEFKRTGNRKDFAVPPPGETLLDLAVSMRPRRVRGRKDLRHLYRPRRHQACSRRRRTRASSTDARSNARGEGRRPRLHQLHRLRPDLRAPPRRRRLCRLPGGIRSAACRS